MLAERMSDLVRDLAGEPLHPGRTEWRYRGRDGGADALRVHAGGAKRGCWSDYLTGDYGDALALVAHLRREPMSAAYGWALGWLGINGGGPARLAPRAAPAPPESLREAPPPATLDLARRTWREALPASGTMVEKYLASRGLRLEHGMPLRFHPRAWRNPAFGPPGPAMVALMTDPETGAASGVHVTYLRADGGGKAGGERSKIMLGRVGCIRLTAADEVTTALGLAEGIETALAVMQRAGWSPVWAATSAGAMKRFPVLPGIEALTLFADTGSAGLEAARECARRWAAAGHEARLLAPPAGDWDDALPHIGEAA
jgi:hypothetical protein